jgi:hypothetical protein
MSRVELGTLVFETGGPDFRFYENVLYNLPIEHLPAKNICLGTGFSLSRGGYFSDKNYVPGQVYDPKLGGNYPDPAVRFYWEFAVVDEQGTPCYCASKVSYACNAPHGAPNKFQFVFGHAPQDYAVFCRAVVKDPTMASTSALDGRSNDDVQRIRKKLLVDATKNELLTTGWRRVREEELATSLKILSDIHYVPSRYYDKDETGKKDPVGLPWLADSPWKDTSLRLSVRVEMRDGSNNLLATSDRLAPGAGRTSPERVWRDHMFRFVLLKLRLMLFDNLGEPWAERRYRLKVKGAEKDDTEDSTGRLGIIERLVPAGAEEGTLELLPGEGGSSDCMCVFSLRLGYLDPSNTVTGQQARLNNLGLSASITGAGKDAKVEVDGEPSGQLERALQRFEELDPPGPASENWGNPPGPVTSGNEVKYLIDAGAAFKEMVDWMRKANGEGDFVYLLGWWLDWNLQLVPGDVGSTIQHLFEKASASRVQLRAMLFTHVMPGKDDPGDWIPSVQVMNEIISRAT